MNIIKKMTEIGPFRKPKMSYHYPSSLSKDESTKWLKGFSGGEIGGLEVLIKNRDIKIQLMDTTPSLLSTQEQKDPFLFDSALSLMTEGDSFQLYLKKPSIYSITILEGESWLKELDDINGAAWIQILFQKDKRDKWKALLKQQYDDFSRGISYPSTFAPIRTLQLKIAELSQNISMPTLTIPTFLERQKEPVYRFLIRGFVCGEEIERKEFVSTLLASLNRWKGENEWGVICNDSHTNQIEKWKSFKMPFFNINGSFIIERELATLLPCTNKITTSKVIQPKKLAQKRENIFPIFHFLPYGRVEDEPFLFDQFEKELNGALEKLGVIREDGLHITDCEQGPTLLRLNATLPKGIKLSDLQKTIVDLQTELGITDLGVAQGEGKGTGTLILPRKKRQSVFLRDLVDTEAFKQYTKDKVLPFVIGTTETGSPLFEDIARVKHLLVAGATGSGKSIWLLQFILTLLIWVPSDELMMYLIDPKRVEFPGFAKFKNVMVYTETEEAKKLLKSLIDLMEYRYEELKRVGVRNIGQYNRKMKDTKMPYVVTVIDEFSDFILSDKEKVVEEYIVRLAQKARACGVHLIITTQRPSVDVVTGLIKANLPSRIVFKCSGRNDYSTVLDTKPPFNLLGNGDGTCLMEGKALCRIQGPLIAPSEEEMDHIIETFGKNQSGDAPLSLDIYSEPKQEEISSPMDALKRYIAFSGETRITYIRKHMKMRMNDVKGLMQLLVEEGWLEAPKNRNSGYKLLLTEKEREKFLIEKEDQHELGSRESETSDRGRKL